MKITPALTAYLAIRDDYFGPYYSGGGSAGEGNFWMGGDGNVASGSAYHINNAGCSTTMSSYFKTLLASDNIPIICEPNNAANKTPKFNWAPRVGFAYRVRPNLVVRAGGALHTAHSIRLDTAERWAPTIRSACLSSRGRNSPTSRNKPAMPPTPRRKP